MRTNEAIGATIEFMDANGCVYRGKVTAIVDGWPVAYVLGYPTAFHLTPITPAQAGFALGQLSRAGGLIA